jgi:hypothetical protein
MRKYIHRPLLALFGIAALFGPASAAGADTTPPTAPGNAKVAVAGTRFVRLTWDAATDDSGSVSYEVEEDGVSPAQAVSGLEWTDIALAPETSHSYRVRAVDAAGNASAWQTLTTKTVAEVDGPGYLLGLIFDGIPNTDIASLVFSDAFYDNKPTRAV